MTMQPASTAELNQTAASPILALSMAHEMLRSIAHGNDYDSLDYTNRTDSIGVALRKAQPEAATEEGTETPETIDITPDSLKSPEGRERVSKAMESFTDSTAEVANCAEQFIKAWGDVIDTKLPEATEDLIDLRIAAHQRQDAQEAMLRAIAGR